MHIERRFVTVMFVDLAAAKAGSCERPAPQAGSLAISARLEAIIAAHGGTTEARTGDSIMAMFGARRVQEEDPAKAVRAALALQTCAPDFPSNGSPSTFQLRVGIHTGMVALGPAGPAGDRPESGDSIALASRLLGGAPAGSVVISHDTYRHVYSLFDGQGLGSLTALVRTEPVPADPA